MEENGSYPPGLSKLIASKERGIIGLLNGDMIAFKTIESLSHEWVLIRDPIEVEEFDTLLNLPKKIVKPNWLNGIEIRVSNIQWIVRNPTIACTGLP